MIVIKKGEAVRIPGKSCDCETGSPRIGEEIRAFVRVSKNGSPLKPSGKSVQTVVPDPLGNVFIELTEEDTAEGGMCTVYGEMKGCLDFFELCAIYPEV